MFHRRKSDASFFLVLVVPQLSPGGCALLIPLLSEDGDRVRRTDENIGLVKATDDLFFRLLSRVLGPSDARASPLGRRRVQNGTDVRKEPGTTGFQAPQPLCCIKCRERVTYFCQKSSEDRKMAERPMFASTSCACPSGASAVQNVPDVLSNPGEASPSLVTSNS